MQRHEKDKAKTMFREYIKRNPLNTDIQIILNKLDGNVYNNTEKNLYKKHP